MVVKTLQKTEQLRESLLLKFAKSESKDAGVRLAFRLPDGRKLERTFHQQDTTKVCNNYYYVSLCNSHVLPSVANTCRSCMSLFLLWEK